MIKKSFKKLSLEFHPDKNKSSNAENKYLIIKNAYEVTTTRFSKKNK